MPGGGDVGMYVYAGHFCLEYLYGVHLSRYDGGDGGRDGCGFVYGCESWKIHAQIRHGGDEESSHD